MYISFRITKYPSSTPLNPSAIPFLPTMSISLNSSPLSSFKPLSTPSGSIGGNCCASKVVFFKNCTHKSRYPKLKAVEDKAAAGDESSTEKPVQKINSLFCPQCDGNGAIVCTQCLGNGINSKDHFNGMFKTGGLCWLCRGKRDVLCGECNGAGFLGGFMSTADS